MKPSAAFDTIRRTLKIEENQRAEARINEFESGTHTLQGRSAVHIAASHKLLEELGLLQINLKHVEEEEQKMMQSKASPQLKIAEEEAMKVDQSFVSIAKAQEKKLHTIQEYKAELERKKGSLVQEYEGKEKERFEVIEVAKEMEKNAENFLEAQRALIDNWLPLSISFLNIFSEGGSQM